MTALPTVVRAALAVLALALLPIACGETSAPAPNTPFSQTDLRVGTGAAAVAGNTVVVHYTGWLYDASKTDGKGIQFETSIGSEPFEFVLGQAGPGGAIQGFNDGIPGLRVGGLRRLVIPPSLAYGNVRQGPIPANAGLVFEVELIEIKSD